MASSGPPISDYEYSPVQLPPATASKENVGMESAYVGTSSVAPNLSEKPQDSTAQRPGWTSTYLHTATLLGFAITFLVLLLAVIALAVVDAKQEGIANARSSEHYLWTYGPTAVLVIIAALWNQVEFRVKGAMPWVILQKGPTAASETLLLDYVTPGKPEALLAAMRKSHWPVAIAIVNSFLITLLTVASTGLLVLQETPFTRHDCRLNVTDQFVTSFDTATIGSSSVLATIAIQNNTIGFPPGTTRNATFQSMKPPTFLTDFDNVQVEVRTGSFWAGLDCEIATIVSGHSGCSDRQCHGINVSLAITSPTCEIKSYNLTTGCGMRIDAVSCDVNTTWGIGCDTYADGHSSNRLVFLNGRMNQDLGKADSNGTQPLKVIADNTTTIVCEPKYDITETYVTMDQNGNVKNSPEMSTNTSRIQPFPAWDLVDGLLTATTAVGISLDHGYNYISYDFFPWSTFHKLFIKWVDVAHPASDLKDSSVLQSRAKDMFSMVSAQMAKQSLMRASSDLVLGTCRGTQSRLRVRGLSLYLMGAILVLLIVSSISLLYVAPRRYSSRDPSSIGGLALAVSQSPALLARLSSYGSADLKTIRRRLENFECQSLLVRRDQTGRLAIDVSTNGDLEDAESALEPTEPAPYPYWRPLSLRPVFRSLVIAFLLIMIVLLEVLYSISQKRNGLVKVDPKSDQRFAWAYVPAIVMVAGQTLVGMIAFSSLMVFPYFQLRRRDSSTRNDVLRNYVSETAIKCLWQAASAKHIVVFCMALAMLLAPILTIAVSGLYTASPTSEDVPMTLSVQDQFNSSFRPRDLWFEGGAVAKAASNDIGLLLTQNFTFPLWTFDEIALPKIVSNLPKMIQPNSSALSGSNITVTLPGIRSSLNCSVASSVPINFTDTLDRFRGPIENVTAFEMLGVYDWHGTVPGSFLPWPRPGLQPFGLFTACGYPYSKDMFNTFCGAFGTSEMNWNAFTCSSHIDELDVEVDLDAASLSVLAGRPNESTSRFFSNETLCSGNSVAFPSDMIPSLFGGADFQGQKAIAGFYDPAFQAVVYGLGTRDHLENFPMSEFMNDEGVTKIFDQLQHVHRIVVAQSANLIRVPLNTTSSHAPLATVNATLTNSHTYRLQQSVVSTRVLDGLLVAIALCIALSFLMDTRKVLPKNPASIAAATSLIAGESQMLSKEILPEGAQWFSDAELKEKRVWDGSFFRLGWWDGDCPSEREGKLFKLDSL